MAYIFPNFKTKKEAKEAILKGETVTCFQPTPWGSTPIDDGEAFIEGPHYPEPHRWYGEAKVKNGKVVKIR